MLRGDSKLSEDEIKAYVKDNLANYKVPRDVVFLDELPRNPTGKVLKGELEEMGNSDSGEDEAAAETETSGSER